MEANPWACHKCPKYRVHPSTKLEPPCGMESNGFHMVLIRLGFTFSMTELEGLCE